MRFGGTPGKGPQAQRTQGAVPVQPHSTTPVRPLQPPGLGAESGIAFDPVDGHAHTGADSHTVAYNDLTGRGHQLTGADHTETGLTTGHVLTATGATSFAFQAAAAVSHALLSTTHTDAAAGTVTRGDLITGQGATPKFTRLALGASGRVVKSDGTDIAWGQVAFTELSGTLSAAQHGTQASTAGSTAGSTADHTGTLTANARLLAQKNSVTVGSARPTFNFIEGNGIVYTITDTGTVISITVGLSYGIVTVTEQAFGQAASTGSASSVARSDHTHGTPTNPITAHLAASDPHPQYEQVGNKGQVSGYAELDASSHVPTAQLGTGTANSTKFLRGDQAWAAPAVVQLIDGGYIANVSAVSSGSPQLLGHLDGVNYEYMPYSGTIVGLAGNTNADIGGAGVSLAFEVYTSPDIATTFTASGVTCTITGAAGDQFAARTTSGAVTFAAGTLLAVGVLRTGSLAATAGRARILVVFD